LADLCQKWKTGLENPANVTAFGWNQTEVNEVLGKITAFLTARTAYEETDSTKNRMAKDAIKTAMRDFANGSIRFNKNMTPEDKQVYGIHPRDTTHTGDTEPTSYPEVEPDTSVLRQVTIHF
jgi:hypothetical protein